MNGLEERFELVQCRLGEKVGKLDDERGDPE